MTLSACGGGGGGSKNPQTTGLSISGTISSAENIAVDSDLNDPHAPYALNDGLNEAQTIGNPVMLNGFVSEAGTGFAGDRFELTADASDTFRTSLYSGQFVSLRVANFNSASPRTIDVDFRLYDSGFNLVATSETDTEFESVAVPSDGEYYIQVYAYRGASKYVLSIGSTSLAGARAANGWSAGFVPGEAIVKRSSLSADSPSGRPLHQLRGVSLSNDSLDRVTLLRVAPEARASDLMTEMNAKALMSGAQAGEASLPPETRRKIDTLNLIKQLKQRQDIDSAAPNFLAQAALEPNDTHYGRQEHYRQIRLPQAWDLTTGTPATGEVIVAVVDSGVATDHEDFSGRLIAGYDFVSKSIYSNDGDGIDADPNDPGSSPNPGESGFHGTHVAGTIAAASNNNLGVAGVSWGAKIMPVRVLGLGGEGSFYDIIQGLLFAAGLENDSLTLPARPADIINLSLGSKDTIPDLENTVAQVVGRGVIVIAAAGNNNNANLYYPASYNGVISVSAMDWQNNKASYSNYGSTVDVGAPGGNTAVDNNGDGLADGVFSSVINDSSGRRVSNYVPYQGTSMASPHVAGVVALMKAVHPGLTRTQLDTLLANGEMTNDLGDPGRDDIYGYGMIDALKSVQAAQRAAGSPPPDTVTASPTSVNFDTTQTTAKVTLAGSGTTPPTVTSFDSSEPWLTVTEDGVDGNGYGDYTLTVDRSGLVDAVYTAQARFGLSDGNTVIVSVSMRVQSTSTGSSGNAGYLYLVLFDSELNNSGQLSIAPVNGIYSYTLSGVAPGDYYVVAGSDADNDGSICEVGESCGAYPVRNKEEMITVDRSISGIDFLATINSGLSGTAASAGLTLTGRGLPIKPTTKTPVSQP
jgi:serine protease